MKKVAFVFSLMLNFQIAFSQSHTESSTICGKDGGKVSGNFFSGKELVLKSPNGSRVDSFSVYILEQKSDPVVYKSTDGTLPKKAVQKLKEIKSPSKVIFDNIWYNKDGEKKQSKSLIFSVE